MRTRLGAGPNTRRDNSSAVVEAADTAQPVMPRLPAAPSPTTAALEPLDARRQRQRPDGHSDRRASSKGLRQRPGCLAQLLVDASRFGTASLGRR